MPQWINIFAMLMVTVAIVGMGVAFLAQSERTFRIAARVAVIGLCAFILTFFFVNLVLM